MTGEKKEKATKLEPGEGGNFPCPYCGHYLIEIVREWMNPPRVTDYICHHCQIGFKVAIKNPLNPFL